MKSLVTFALLLTGTLFGQGAGTIGDLNGDGVVNAADAQLILDRSVSAVLLGDTEEAGADLNADGVIDSRDAVLTLAEATDNPSPPWLGLRASASVDATKAVRLSLVLPPEDPTESPVQARILDLAGQLVSSQSISLNPEAEGRTGTASFALADVQSVTDLAPYVLELNGRQDDGAVQKRLSLYAIARRLGGCLIAPDRLAPGFNCRVRVVAQELAENLPTADATVELWLESQNLGAPVLLQEGTTDASGRWDTAVAAPGDLHGEATMIAHVVSPWGVLRLRKTLTVEEGWTTLLTTDKPIYQPGQTIHLRSLTLAKPENVPAAGRDITYLVADSKGNKVFKKVETINEFGVAAADFTLAAELNLGTYTVSATVEEVVVEQAVTVSRYVLPKFKVSLTTAASYYAPGGRLQGSLSAQYFFGKPVAGAPISIQASKFDVGFQAFAQISGTTDAEGNFQFALDLPTYFVGQPLNQGDALVTLEAGVRDGAGHEEKTTLSVPIAASDLILLAVPESGRLIPNVPNRIYLLTTYPDKTPAITTCRISRGDELLATATTDPTGIATVEFTPVGASELVLSIDAADNQGHQVHKSLALALGHEAQSILVRTDRTLYAVGDELKVDVMASGTGGSVFVDVLKDGQTVYTRLLDLVEGQGSAVIPLSQQLAGTLSVSAYRVTLGTDTLRDRKVVYVNPANDLRLQYTPDRDTYRPGAPATLRVRVSDADNQPVVAAVGLNVVDEAVFALQEIRPGMEKVYFYLEEQLRTPRYEIHGFEPNDLLSETHSDPGTLDNAARDRALGFLFASLASNTTLSQEAVSTGSTTQPEVTEMRQRLMDGVWADLRPLITDLKKEFQSQDEDRSEAYYETKLVTAVVQGLDPEAIADPWGTRYRVSYLRSTDRFTLTSAGPDQRWSTADDLAIVADSWMLQNEWWWGAPQWAWLNASTAGISFSGRDLGGMAVLAANGWPGGVVDWLNAAAGGVGGPGREEDGGSGAQPYLRQYFPETLYHNPLIITGPDGVADVTLNMADSITTWRLTGLASTQDGRLGSASATVRCFQEFFVDLDLPVSLTRGDEVSVPVAVYNYLPDTQTVRLALEPGSWFDLLDASEKSLTLAPNQVSVVHFRVKTSQVGHHRLQVSAYGSAENDAVAREVEVLPDGKEFLVTYSGRLSGAVEKVLAIPAAAIEGASKIFVKIYPGLFSQVVEGLDAMLQMPFGCFEQTSSVTYPNVLAVQYMKATGQITPEILMKAEGFISAGYQRLLSYEVSGGGFEWFGNPPAHNILTTYGLMEFADMSAVWYVDPEVIRRTQDWLAANQEPDGSWIPTDGGIAEGAIDRYRNDVLRTTAYVLWGLTHSGYTGPAVDQGTAYLESRLADSSFEPETYSLALCAQALLVDPENPRLDSLFQTFEERKQTDGDLVWWTSEAETVTYSSGKSADIELTGLLAQAYMRGGRFPDTVTKALNYLVAAKDGSGNFGSTQATVMALQAFCMAARGATQAPDATIHLALNGSEPVTLKLDAANGDLLQLVDLQEHTATGNNLVQLDLSGTGSCLYQIVGRYYLPWNLVSPSGPELISIDVNYDRAELAVNDTVTCQVHVANNRTGIAKMVLIDVGLPPGFDLLTEDLDAMVGSTIQKYQVAGRQLILYLDELSHNSPVTLHYRLVARYPIRAQAPESTVYEYYSPDIRAVAKPQELVVSASE